MANIDQIIKKSKEKIERQVSQKKIVRTGPSRPWQEGLEFLAKEEAEKAKKAEASLNDSISCQTHNTILNATVSATVSENEDAQESIPLFNADPLNASTNTYNKPTSEPTTVVQHTYNKPTSIVDTNIQQTYNTKCETYNILTSEPTTVVQQKHTPIVLQNLQHKLQHTYNKPTSVLFSSGVSRLSGQRLRALSYLFDRSLANGSRLTGPVTIETLSSSIECASPKTVQTVVYRLEKDGYINRSEYKAGRGGWTSYEIPQEIYNQMIQLTSKPTTNLLQNLQHNIQHTYNKPTSTFASEPTSTLSSKIDSLNFKNNLSNYLGSDGIENSDRLNKTGLQETWFMDLDFSTISPIKATHVNSSIRSLVQVMLSPERVQSFIVRYKSWMATQDTSKIKNPIALFCDKLKEFASIKKSDVEDCLTEEERQAEVEFMASVNKAKAELDFIQKSKAFQNEKELNDQLEIQFNEWFSVASEQEKIELSQPSTLTPVGSDYYKMALKAAYQEKVFKVGG